MSESEVSVIAALRSLVYRHTKEISGVDHMSQDPCTYVYIFTCRSNKSNFHSKISMNLAPASLDKSQVISVSVWYLKFFKGNDIRLGMFHGD